MTQLFHARWAKSTAALILALSAVPSASVPPSLRQTAPIPASPAAPSAAAPASAPAAKISPLFGRWTVSDEKPYYTLKGRAYKTVDIAPCHKDFCGVSVGQNGKCSTVLFRFLMKHAANERLDGHGKWGDAMMNLSIESYTPDKPGSTQFYLGLGDKKYQMDSRNSSMPKFTAQYRRTGNATCTAK